jgi:hypothetical protein
MRKILTVIGLAALFLAAGSACRPNRSWGDLSRLADECGTDKGPSAHAFTQYYEGFFTPLRDRPIRFFEIGVDKGYSLRLWEKYFPKAEIFGADIVDKSVFDSARVHTGIADQSDRAALARFVARFGPTFDVILDDGGHTMRQQQISFGFLFRCVKPGGLYIIEDVHTSFYDLFPLYGADPDGRNTTLTMIEDFLRTRTFSSLYMRRSEREYLSRVVESCVLTYRRDSSRSMTCIIRKRIPHS